MPQEWVRRDVQLVLDKLKDVDHAIDTLQKMTNLPESLRSLAIARNHTDTAKLWLADLAGKTPESL